MNENNTSVDITKNSINTQETTNHGTVATTAKTSTNQTNKNVAAGDNSPTAKPLGEIHALWVRYDSLDSVNASYLKKNGVTDLLVLTPRKDPSSLQGFINKCKPVGIRVHAWIVCFKDFDDNFVDPETGVMEDQNIQTWLRTTIKTIATKYDIDGIHLDYVRYPGTAYKHDNATNIITNFVYKVRNTLDWVGTQKGKYLYLSAAVISETNQTNYYYGQSYEKLSPFLDFMAPMIYKGSYNQDTEWIGKTTAYIVTHSTTKVVAGLMTYNSDEDLTALTASELRNDVKSAMKNGASGYSLFRLGLIDTSFYPYMKTTFTIKKFNNFQISKAAVNVKKYIEKYKKLPTTVTVGTTKVNMAQFLHLITNATLTLKKANATTTLKIDFNPETSQDDLISGTLSKDEYLGLAQNTNQYMNSNKKAPSSGSVSLGKMGYANQIYLFSRILMSNLMKKTLPVAVIVKSFDSNNIPVTQTKTAKKLKSSKATNDTSNITFNNYQISRSSINVKKYIEKYKKLPTTVTVGTTKVNMAQFLHLITNATLTLDVPKTTTTLKNYTLPATSNDNITSGTLTKTEYMDFAKKIGQFLNIKQRAPTFGYTSQGKMGYQNQIYLYSRILSTFLVEKALPEEITVKAFKSENIPIIEKNTTNSNKSSTTDTTTAAVNVKNYLEKYKKLPLTVLVGKNRVNMAQFLYLMTKTIQQFNSKTNTTISYNNAKTPDGSLHDNVTSGHLSKSEYIDFAKRISDHITKNSNAPLYGLTSRGEISFQSQVYLFSRVLSFYSTSKRLPVYETIKPWKDSNIPLSHELTSFTPSTIVKTANKLNSYITTYKQLPETIEIDSDRVTMAQFLRLMTKAIIQLNDNNNSSITLNNDQEPILVEDNLKSGDLSKAEYLDLSKRILAYFETNRRAPSFGVIGLGNISYKSQVSIFSKILSNYTNNNILPTSVKVESWNGVPAEYQQYLKPTKNCQSDNARIINLANSITKGATTTYDKAVRLFNWVRDNVPYAWYYNSQKGALGLLDSPSGNCCDHANLVVALCRASGIPAKYKHGVCTFSSGLVVGHVWARVWVNGKWYDADAVTKRNDFGVIRNWNTASYKLIGEYTSLEF